MGRFFYVHQTITMSSSETYIQFFPFRELNILYCHLGRQKLIVDFTL